jgi:diaminohydroxyphosphoribosylaminopyrimidine deaminase / 5-amino-6-(5-phosphoribosylamino)uracil reductase
MNSDADFLRRALELASEGLGLTSPNPAVGAVVVKDGRVVGEGFHTYPGVKHAEVLALEQAGEQARGATLYLTLEPCCHTGRTSPCTEAVIRAGVRRVVAAMQDPNPQVSGRGFEQLKAAGIDTAVAGEFTGEALKLNEPFVHFMRTGCALVTLKSAVTLDGKIAAPEDNEGWITSEQARLHVQQLRHQADVMMTGIGTVLSDDCLLTDRTGKPRSRPLLRVVLDSQLRLPVTSQMVASCSNDVLVATTTAASPQRRACLEQRGVEVITCDGPDGRTDLHAVVRHLSQRNYLSIMIEAGSKVNWAALECGVVDRIFFYYAPKILGGMQSLPVAGGAGRRRRVDALQFRDVRVHSITSTEFAVEAYLVK